MLDFMRSSRCEELAYAAITARPILPQAKPQGPATRGRFGELLSSGVAWVRKLNELNVKGRRRHGHEPPEPFGFSVPTYLQGDIPLH